MIKYDEGPCFNWPPSEVLAMTDAEVAAYAALITRTREEYAKAVAVKPPQGDHG